MSKGVMFSRKANMWLYYENYNDRSPDRREWCISEEKAREFLKEVKDES